ncbi:zinc finger protein 280C isoform X1 [Platichthys flesus]|uniref:zinc finger protein 280C isoform X1 n=1 Tax=Platichthys flesus TaxID=8260 RepID=UPI002DB93A2E|nr:zinc finger protein 280C isoform X1 [Platichthys flesus]
MSELFMECVEEELEPWQKQAHEVQMIEDDDDDDEPIFVGVLSNNQKSSGPLPQPPQASSAGIQEVKRPDPHPSISSSQIMVPLNITGNTVTTASPTLAPVTPQPVIVNNQGFIVTSPQLVNNPGFIASLGRQYPPGTSFAIVAAGQQQIFQQVSQGTIIPSAVHRPQVQQISNNIVTLSNVQSPTVYSTQLNQLKPNQPISLQTFSVPTKANNTDQTPVKRGLILQQTDIVGKKAKLNLDASGTLENGINTKCPKCHEEFTMPEALKFHINSCCIKVESTAPSAVNPGANKRIMLVSEFYYGQFDGDGSNMEVQKTNGTFKCQSCLKTLKNNIRFMNHMKHHLELEKQNSESWESYTTCQHCYRQYMTPFQLQCHIESAHSSVESSTICKICELAFESEQVLLEHMKDNHKPGEMPYVCQVCNYRSSFFSDVETHFRTVHENTKDLLCPFCLRVLKTSHMYMQHYMKHQKKGIHRCGKCRLNFLTYKEKIEHRTHFHKTFRKPKALEGLPPGTKVTIRASVSGKTPLAPTSPERPTVTVTPGITCIPSPAGSLVSVSKAKSNVTVAAKGKVTQSKKKEPRPSKLNLALRNLRINQGSHTCIECNAKVNDLFSHFPMVSNCGACKYKTSCKVAIGNHMIRYHSTITKNRYLKKESKKNASKLKLTIVCLNCDLLMDASIGGDLMSKHLNERPNHICKVIQEKADVKNRDRAQYVLEQPPKTVYLTATPFPPTPKEMDIKLEEKVSPKSFTVAAVDLILPTVDREKGSTGLCVDEDVKPKLPPTSSPPTSDGAFDVPVGDVPVGDSERAGVPEHGTGELQIKCE